MYVLVLKVIDLDVVDTMGSKKDNEELRIQMKSQEIQNAAELSKWNALIEESSEKIASKLQNLFSDRSSTILVGHAAPAQLQDICFSNI